MIVITVHVETTAVKCHLNFKNTLKTFYFDILETKSVPVSPGPNQKMPPPPQQLQQQPPNQQQQQQQQGQGPPGAEPQILWQCNL